MRVSALCLFILLTLMGACQTAPESAEGTRYRSNHISQEEIGSIENAMGLTARQVIRRLRPAWIRPRSSTVDGRRSTPVVFQDGIQLGGLENLDQMHIRQIQELRYLSGSDATTRYGTGYSGGAILVFTRRYP